MKSKEVLKKHCQTLKQLKMKSSKKILLLQKDILNAMKAINEINNERISENKTPSSGMVVFRFGSKAEIATFGNFDDFHESLFEKAKENEDFRDVLKSVETRFLVEKLEERCLNVFKMEKPSPKKFPSGGLINNSKVVFDETTKIPKEFVMTKRDWIESRKKDSEEKNSMEEMDDIVGDFFNSLNEMFKPKDQK